MIISYIYHILQCCQWSALHSTPTAGEGEQEALSYAGEVEAKVLFSIGGFDLVEIDDSMEEMRLRDT